MERDLINDEGLHLVEYGCPARKETASDAVRHLIKAEIKARGLDVFSRDGKAPSRDDALIEGLSKVLARQHAVPLGEVHQRGDQGGTERMAHGSQRL